VLCQHVIVEETTRNVSAVNCYTERYVERFPTVPLEFDVFAILAGGHGEVTLKLQVCRPDTLMPILSGNVSLDFPDPLQEVRFIMRKIRCIFPIEGKYQVELLADGEPIALTAVAIRLRGAGHV
jgi:hypothetical protein